MVAVPHPDPFYAAVPLPLPAKEDTHPYGNDDGTARPADSGGIGVLRGGVHGEDLHPDAYPAEPFVFLVHVKG